MLFQGELLPSHARSFGSGLIGILDNISMFISCKMVPKLNVIMGLHGVFFMYTWIVLGVGLTSYFVMPETTGLSLEEIENMYRSDKKKSKK